MDSHTLDSMSGLMPTDQYGNPLLVPPRRSKKPAAVAKYTIAEALKLKAKVTGQNEFVASKRRGEKGRIAAPGAESETWAKLTPERKMPYNQLAQHKNEAQRRVGKKELKDIIKNAIYQYIPDDDTRVDFASRLIGEIKEKCEQLARVAELDVAFYTVGERIDQLSQDQGCYGNNMIHPDVRNIFQDSVKRVTSLCTNHRQHSQQQMLEFKEALQRASMLPRQGASGDPANRQQAQMLSLLSSLMGVLGPPNSSSSSSSAPSAPGSTAAGNLTAAAAALAAMPQFNGPMPQPRPSGGPSGSGPSCGSMSSDSLSKLTAMTNAMNAGCSSSNYSGSSSGGGSSSSGQRCSHSSNGSCSGLNGLTAVTNALNSGPNSGINGLAAVTSALNNGGCLGGLGSGSSGLGLSSLGSSSSAGNNLGSSTLDALNALSRSRSGNFESSSCGGEGNSRCRSSVGSGFGMPGDPGNIRCRSSSSTFCSSSCGDEGNGSSSGSSSSGEISVPDDGPSRFDGTDAWSAESLAQLKRSRPMDSAAKHLPPTVPQSAIVAAAAAVAAAATAAAKRTKR